MEAPAMRWRGIAPTASSRRAAGMHDGTRRPASIAARSRGQAPEKLWRSMDMSTRDLETTVDDERVTTDKVRADLRMLAADTEALLKATAGQTGQQIAQVRARAEESLQAARARATDLQDAALARARAAGRAADGYAHANPWRLMAACAVAGLLLGYALSSGGDSDA
jgi:ElaB/YqjD/DUF883 family membrane-anchored ribosome-binding protein